MTSLSKLANALQQKRGPLVVCTGAGVSLASGIPTFRGPDPGAVWSVDVTELGTRRFFNENPTESWRWYLGRFDKLTDKLPNPAHHAIVELERWKRENGRLRNFLLITQNIDGLHRKAGSQALVEVHGCADRLRCSRPGCENGSPHGSLPRADFEADFVRFQAEPVEAHLPRCPRCGSLLRPHILWFDEYYDEHDDYGYRSVLGAASQASLLLFCGTSFAVGVTAALLRAGTQRNVPMWSIDPSGERPDPAVEVVAMKAEEALPALVQLCRA